ncbi:uncharacterized protein LOC128880347 [Hylaeus volcanicus]|uniref:uncharacterized protein LOC128880347 n=1 Tax=Hylaeus volcanicus TaxID=313075 RepID=UPI0023B87FA4|nr:uncharacterized protein LOC128880347 [Hylaeus volcanicus]
MVNDNSDDSTSSEDEISKNALKEATDHQFYKNTSLSTSISNNSQKTNTHDNSVRTKDSTTLKSLRQNLERKDQFENFGVSPSFQNYVAKKLDEAIEKSIKLKNKKTKNGHCTNDKEAVSNSSGIKLLNSSVDFLTDKEEVEEPQKKRKIQMIEDETNLAKCKEVAVDPEAILAKADTKVWKSKRKEPEFKYKKLKNGTLVEETVSYFSNLG